MKKLPIIRLVTVITSLLVLATGCGQAVESEGRKVEADRSSFEFFDRPKTLAEARRSSTPYPLVVMEESDPWASVIGSDSPSFALYSDGTVIFRTDDGFKFSRLTKSKTETVLAAFDNPELSRLRGYYQSDYSTDQPDNNLLVYGYGDPFYISVYGRLDNREVRSTLPRAVLRAFDQLRNFTAPNAETWLPGKVEVMVWPFENAAGNPVAWPDRWPGLDHSDTLARGDSYSIFVPSAELPALTTFLAARNRTAIEMNGRKWSAALRLPFPHEALWMAPARD